MTAPGDARADSDGTQTVTRRLTLSLACAAAIVVLATSLGLLANAVSGASVPLIAEEASPGSAITLAEARRVHANGDATFVDARRRDDYRAGHIAGSISTPLAERAAQLGDLRRELPRTGPLVVYCEAGACTSALALSAWLSGNGWRDVRVLSGGYPAWEAAGFPISRGDQP
jgi:rhodanese-related sulfurtransferase